MADEKAIRAAVRDHYADLALTVVESCCSPSAGEGTIAQIYTPQELDAVPVEAVAAAAGCGNPTALGELRTGDAVLDLGSGGGIDCFLAARQVGASGSVVGVDMTPEMLALARRNGGRLGLRNVAFLRGDLQHLPLDEESVDVVISNCVICLTPDKGQVFREAFRVLRPGGRLYVSDMVSDSELAPELRGDAESWASCVTGAEPREGYLATIAAAGFSTIETTPESAPSGVADQAIPIYSLKVKAVKAAA